MSFKPYAVQLYGFCVKVFLQRWRTPIISLVEILLPFLFVLFLGISYWTTENTTIPPQLFDGGGSLAMNYSQFVQYLFCQGSGNTFKSFVGACRPAPTTCLSLIGNGKEVCYYDASASSISGLSMPLSYHSGGVAIFSLDAYLVWSAYMTEEAITTQPTFLGRSSRASISHYGELLISSDSAALAADFMNYCEEESSLCTAVLHNTPFSSFDEAEEYAKQHPNNIWAIVDLPSSMLSATSDAVFTIGMNFTATPWTFEQNTRRLFSRPSSGGDGYTLYWSSGFLTLQQMVENFFTEILEQKGTPVAGPASLRDPDPQLGIQTFLNNHGQALIPMPTPPTFSNTWLTNWQYYVPLVVVMSAIFPVSRLTALIVEEKSNGIRESMLIMGMHRTCMFSSWYLPSLPLNFVAALLAAVTLKASFLTHTNFGILLVVFFTFLQQCTALAIFISTLFSNPRLGSWCAAFLVFIFAVPAYNFSDGMASIAKLLLSMLPCIGFTLSFFDMTEYALFGRSFTWDIARKGSFNVAIAVGMMWASWGIFMLLAFYLDRVWPGTVGRQEPWYFPLRPLIRCFYERKAPKPVPMTQDLPTMRRDMYTGLPEVESSGAFATGVADSSLMYSTKERSTSGMIQHADDVVDPLNEDVAAVFDGVYKVYIGGGLVGWLYTFFVGLFRRGDRTVALDGVTFSMRKGEVSVLLGPNGAGKSTIMGIATGMVQPTAGEVYIRGIAASEDLDKCREHIGYCPQVDIVWDNLTVDEHLAFYARLKHCNTFGVKDHVDKVVSLLDLEEARGCKAQHLSGGQRRRLCVGIALVADSSVLLLDEPTAGMDIQGRKIVYDALNRSRECRSVLLCTHLLDEADRIGDRVLIMNQGKLCAEGSAMYLKSQMEVGYSLTCVLESDLTSADAEMTAQRLIEFVKENGYKRHHEPAHEVVKVPSSCQMLGVERYGREVTFRFPLSLLSNDGQALLSALQSHTAELSIRSVSLNLTTLEDVFLSVTTGSTTIPTDVVDVKDDKDTPAEVQGDVVGSNSDVTLKGEVMYESSSCIAVFFLHFRALFLKRCHFARRDLMLLLFQVVIPVLFLTLSLLIGLIRSPTQPSRVLDMTMFPNEYGEVHMTYANSDVDENAFKISSATPDAAVGDGNYLRFVPSTHPSDVLNGSLFLTELYAAEVESHALPRHYGFATSGVVNNSAPKKNNSVLFHNISSIHAAPMGLSALYNLARYQVFGSSAPKLQVRNRPMPIGEFEQTMWDANKQVVCGIFVILPFILIPCNTISYIVREKETGARHMQWLSGASVAAYWLSSFVFDFACYIATEGLALILFVIFDRTEYILKENLPPTIVLFLFFGFSSVAFSYLLSFFFDSSFAAQTIVLLFNFVFGFMWVTMEEMLALGAYEFVYYLTAILRILPAVSFAEGLYVLAGRRIGSMMYPDSAKESVYAMLTLTREGRFAGGLGTGMIYMGCVTVGSAVLLVVLEYARIQRAFRSLGGCFAKDTAEGEGRASAPRDPSVVEEERRVCSAAKGPADDMIAAQHLTKYYFGSSRAAVSEFSLGVRKGEVVGLLGLNGAGKSTAIGILAGETTPTSGVAFVNHLSVMDSSSRSYIGYCPQYNPLLDLLSPKEHLWLYARLRGMREEMIAAEVDTLIHSLGLYPHRHQAAAALSGGNKRRLSLAVALVGRTTSVLLDEPTAGMDALARSQTCSAVKQLTKTKSVILTTHLLDEVEAMADRVAFMSRGHMSCVGTPHELRSRADRDSVYTMIVTFDHHVDLTSEHAQVPELVEQYVRKVIQGDDAKSSALSDPAEDNSASSKERWCEVREVHISSLSVTVMAPLVSICRAVSGLREGLSPEVPTVDFISVSQPTLEDILLHEEEELKGAE